MIYNPTSHSCTFCQIAAAAATYDLLSSALQSLNLREKYAIVCACLCMREVCLFLLALLLAPLPVCTRLGMHMCIAACAYACVDAGICGHAVCIVGQVSVACLVPPRSISPSLDML